MGSNETVHAGEAGWCRRIVVIGLTISLVALLAWATDRGGIVTPGISGPALAGEADVQTPPGAVPWLPCGCLSPTLPVVESSAEIISAFSSENFEPLR